MSVFSVASWLEATREISALRIEAVFGMNTLCRSNCSADAGPASLSMKSDSDRHRGGSLSGFFLPGLYQRRTAVERYCA